MDIHTALTWLIGMPLVASPIIYLVGRLAARRSKNQNNPEERSPNPASWLASIILAATLVPFWFTAKQYFANGRQTSSIGSIELQVDGLSILLTGTVLVLGLLVSIYSAFYLQRETGEEKYYALLSAMIGSIIGLSCAADLFNLWVWFEAMAISSYMLVAFYRDQPASIEAGVKYLVQNAAGSVLALLGIALVFLEAGSLNLYAIRASVQGESCTIILAAAALFIVGFGVKTALVPLHTWLPDAHSQAPSGISAMLSGVVIEAGLLTLLRALGCIFGCFTNWGIILLAFGALNMLVGNLMALRQKQVKRMLAYSSVSHMGYMLLGLGFTFLDGTPNGAAGSFLHLFNHAMMKGLAFLSAGALLYAIYLVKSDHKPLELDDLNGASKRYPFVAFVFSVGLLGLGGLPPLSGFMSKWQIFVSGFQIQNSIGWIMVIFAAFNSVLSLGYYAPLINRMYRREPAPSVLDGGRVPVLMNIPLVILCAAVVILGVYPSLLSAFTNQAATSLINLLAY